MHPYSGLSDEQFWRTGVGSKAWSEINFKPSSKFQICGTDRVATAGSCFAQHIAKALPELGLAHFIAETAPRILPPERVQKLHYGVFSARYGNIYTVRQLRQLLEFAFDIRPRVVLAEHGDDGWSDLLRPGVQAEGYDSLHDLTCDRAYHLDCVRDLFLQADFFVFTLGLTEYWYDDESGVVFPVCPGTKAGTFDASRHKFANTRFAEVVEDLRWCIDFVGAQNPKLKWIFTVSPVALAATRTDQHVLVATSASKAVLRAAVDEICSLYEHCDYFPSYEITASVANFGRFLNADLRTISDLGVQCAMKVFKKAFVVAGQEPLKITGAVASVGERISAAVEAECDEIFNDPMLFQVPD